MADFRRFVELYGMFWEEQMVPRRGFCRKSRKHWKIKDLLSIPSPPVLAHCTSDCKGLADASPQQGLEPAYTPNGDTLMPLVAVQTKLLLP